MNNIDSISAKRVFLPDIVLLQSSVCSYHASLLTSRSDGRAHDECVEELYAPFRSSDAPFLVLDEEEGELVVVEPCRALAKRLRARGFARQGRDPAFALPIEHGSLVETLAWAEAEGMGLCHDAWDALGDAGRRPRPRQLAWDSEHPAFGDEKDGDWATRLLRDGEGLKADLRDAIDMSDERAVHLTPLPDGSLRARLESTDFGLEPWLGPVRRVRRACGEAGGLAATRLHAQLRLDLMGAPAGIAGRLGGGVVRRGDALALGVADHGRVVVYRHRIVIDLRFDPSEIDGLAAKYVAANFDQKAEDAMETTISPKVRSRGHYKKDEFVELCRWKTPRSKKHCASNANAFVEEATAVALGASDERLRIGVLTLLKGVSFPTASVLLHFGSADPYPILDFRALEALGAEEPSWYSFEFWWEYVLFCRGLADQAGVSMRTLDRAMWQWSKDAAKL